MSLQDFINNTELNLLVDGTDSLIKTIQSKNITYDEWNRLIAHVKRNITAGQDVLTGFQEVLSTFDEVFEDIVALETTLVGMKTDKGEIFNDYENNVASGARSKADGYDTKATGDYSYAGGWKSEASGPYANAWGIRAKATGKNTYARGADTEASADHATADGNETEADGIEASAHGYATRAHGRQSVADGSTSIAWGDTSAAHNERTIAYGQGSTSEGGSRGYPSVDTHISGQTADTLYSKWLNDKNFTAAIGNYSHAGGYDCCAKGTASFAGGNKSLAQGTYSIAYGNNLHASVDRQAVFGTFNSANPDALFMVGFGSSESDRKNAFYVDRYGLAHVYRGRLALASELITRDDVDERINTLILASDPEGGKTIANIQTLVKYVDENAGEISALISTVDENADRIESVEASATENKKVVDSIVVLSKNLYNVNAAIDGVRLSNDQVVGESPKYENGTRYAVSDSIRVESGESYVFSRPAGLENYTFKVVFLDADGKVIGYANPGSTTPFVAPEGACFIRFSHSKEYMYGLGCQLEKGVSPTPYESFGYKIKEDALRNTDYYAHYNYRAHQLIAEHGFGDGSRMCTRVLPLNENSLVADDFQGGKYTDTYLIMHPKTSGTFSINAGAGMCYHLLVAKGVAQLNVKHNVDIIDLSLFTDGTVFPRLSPSSDFNTSKVLVQKGRKEELQVLTNWSNCNIEEVETW